MTEEATNLQVESVAAEDGNTFATRERNLPSYLSDYTDVPRQKKLLVESIFFLIFWFISVPLGICVVRTCKSSSSEN